MLKGRFRIMHVGSKSYLLNGSGVILRATTQHNTYDILIVVWGISQECLRTRLKMFSARSVNRPPSIATAGHGQANSAISAWCVGCSLPIGIERGFRRDRYALPAVALCIYIIMMRPLYASGVRDTPNAGHIRKCQKRKYSVPHNLRTYVSCIKWSYY
jgi:hypothetical protein